MHIHLDGITKAVSLAFKNDTVGIGGKDDGWGFAWWYQPMKMCESKIGIIYSTKLVYQFKSKKELVVYTHNIIFKLKFVNRKFL